MTTMGYTKVADCAVVHATEKAILIETDEGEKHWIPKSMLHDDSECFEADTDGDLILVDTIADEKGLDGEPYSEQRY